MTEPAKDEAELLDAMADAIWDYLAPETRWTAKPYVERDLRAAIRAAGWTVVPVKPTIEMFEAGWNQNGGGFVAGIWRSMIAAAPGVKHPEPVCVNAHDRCYGGAGGPCPYCEMPAAPEVKP